MGKKRKNSQRQGNNNNQGGGGKANNNQHNHNKSNKKRKKNSPWKRPRYWIEDFRETQGLEPEDAALTVLVTRSELTDDHVPKGQKNSDSSAKDIKENDDEEKEDKPEQLQVKSESAIAVEDEETSKPPAIVAELKEEAATEEILEDTAGKQKELIDELLKEDVTEEKKEEKKEENAELKKDVPEETKETPTTETDTAVSLTSSKAAMKNPDNDGSDNKKSIFIRRDASARGKPKKFSNQRFKHLPGGDCGDGIKNPFPKHVVADKYWAQRHRLFSRFDQGIELDMESWYSVTPEAIANHIADKMVEPSSIVLPTQSTAKQEDGGLVVLDAFCGAGGNAIALANHTKVALVVCIDIDMEKLKLAAQNAKIYEVPSDKLLFIHADAFEVLSQYHNGSLIRSTTCKSDTNNNYDKEIQGYRLGEIDLLPPSINSIFLSPPWGGVDYENIGPKKFDLKCIRFDDGNDGEKMIMLATCALPPKKGIIACFLPRNLNGLEVGKSALKVGISGTMEMEQNILNDKFKAVTIYMGKAEPSTERIASDQS